MERLLCCLLGFPEKDAQVLRSLTRLFRPSLSADWAFDVGVTEDCDLLVCDLDDTGGLHAWNSPAPPGLLRAAASANDVDAGALLLRKPLRGHGPSGIVQVLNAAAAIKRPDIAPPTPPPATASAGPAQAPPAPSAFFKPEPAPRPAPRPVPSPPPPAAEAPLVSPARPPETEPRDVAAEVDRRAAATDAPVAPVAYDPPAEAAEHAGAPASPDGAERAGAEQATLSEISCGAAVVRSW